MVTREDKNFIDSLLHGLAFKVYSIGDINMLEGKANEALVREYELYLGERAQEIFGLYRDADYIERVRLGLRASMEMEEYYKILKEEEEEEEKGKDE